MLHRPKRINDNVVREIVGVLLGVCLLLGIPLLLYLVDAGSDGWVPLLATLAAVGGTALGLVTYRDWAAPQTVHSALDVALSGAEEAYRYVNEHNGLAILGDSSGLWASFRSEIGHIESKFIPAAEIASLELADKASRYYKAERDLSGKGAAAGALIGGPFGAAIGGTLYGKSRQKAVHDGYQVYVSLTTTSGFTFGIFVGKVWDTDRRALTEADAYKKAVDVRERIGALAPNSLVTRPAPKVRKKSRAKCDHSASEHRMLSDGALVCLDCGRSFLPRGER